MVLTMMLTNFRETGYPLRRQVWDLMTPHIWQLAFSDAIMVGSTALCLPMHKVFRNSQGQLRWDKMGMPIQSIFEVAWLGVWVKYDDRTSKVYTRC